MSDPTPQIGMPSIVFSSIEVRRLILIACALFLILAQAAWAKRVPPKPVVPVVQNGIEYSAAGDGRTGYVVAKDVATSRELWRVRIFRVHIHFWMEECVQSVYISDLELTANALLVRDERSRCYRLDLKSRHVKRQSCD